VTSYNFPLRRALTMNFRAGTPRDVTVREDGRAALFLRSGGAESGVTDLWALVIDEDDNFSEERVVAAVGLPDSGDLPEAERARRERMREAAGGITAYSCDKAQTKVALAVGGTLFVTDLAANETTAIAEGGVSDVTMSPTGDHVSFVRDGSLFAVDLATGTQTCLAEREEPSISWGSAEFIAAEEMGRYRGHWWSPDGTAILTTRVDESPVAVWHISNPALPSTAPRPQRYPAAGQPNAVVSLFLLDLEGGRHKLSWDDEYEYLTRVHWGDEGDPIFMVQSRDQRRAAIYSVTPERGSARLVTRWQEDPWIDLTPGVPRQVETGILDVIVDTDHDTHRLALRSPKGLDPTFLTPEGCQVRAVSRVDDEGVWFVGTIDMTTQDLWHVTWDGETTRHSEPGGWSSGSNTGGTMLVGRAEPDEPRTTLAVTTAAGNRYVLSDFSETCPITPEPDFLAIGTTHPNTAVLWPQQDREGPVPIIMSPYGGPHAQRAIRAGSAFLTEQWLANQGYCVIVSDGPGTPRTPSWEALVAGDLATGPLQGQVDALTEIVAQYGDRVDPDRVGIRGWSFGGYLAALAVLARPDLFHVAVAGAPVTHWQLYDTHYTERYLGDPRANTQAYTTSSLLARAAELTRPLLLVHGLSDDNVVVAHTLQLSTALLGAGRPHNVLPLSGVTHMTPQASVAENLLNLDVGFLSEHLHPAAR